MKVDKNSPLGEMLLKMAAEHDPKLRRAIRNDEVGDLNIIALGAPDDGIKDLLESLFMGEDKCKNCGEVKAATPTDADDASNLDALLDELRNLVCDDDTPEAVAMPSRIVLLSNDIMQILNHLLHLIAPKKDVPYTVRRAEMLGAIKDAMLDARADIVTVLARYPEFAEITDKYFDDDEEDTAETE